MKRLLFVLTMLVACIGLVTTTHANPPAASVYEFKLQKPEDSIVVRTDDKLTLFVVTTASGIGDATVALTPGQWPKNITLRFQYPKGREFTVLEGFSITTPRLRVQDAARPGQTKMPFQLLDGEGKSDAGDAPAGGLNVGVERRQGGLGVGLPSYFFAGSKEVKFSWIDFYR